MAGGYFVCSYVLVYNSFGNEELFAATVGNIIFIFFILALDKAERYLYKNMAKKLENKKDKKSTFLYKIIKSDDIPIRAGLYFFYIVLVICSAIVAADPKFPYLENMTGYFQSVEYGILVLIAADGFMGQLFKDIENTED